MNNKLVWILLIALFFVAGAAGSYFFMKGFAQNGKTAAEKSLENVARETEDFIAVRMYYPADYRLDMTEKRLPRRTKQSAIAEAVIEEYFKGPGNAAVSFIPQGVKILGLYKDPNQVLYIDLSDELRRNFQGDAFSEYLVLKGLYESLISNLQDYQDYRILVDGKEIETLGGHFYLKYSLKNTVASEVRGENKAGNE